jgi:phage/plasmid-like protein (TIGR03299 family)
MPVTTHKPLSMEDIRAMLQAKNKPVTSTTPAPRKTATDWGKSDFFSYGVNHPCHDIDEALAAFKLDWLVKVVDLRSNSPEIPEHHDLDFFDHKGLIRSDNLFPLSTVGASIYTPIQNRECLELIEDILQNHEITIESGAVMDYGRRVWIACRLPNPFMLNFKNGEKQTIIRYVHLSWSHDQTQAVTVSFMPYAKERKLSLASFAPMGVPTSISFKHTTFARDRMKKGGEIMSKAMRFFEKAEEMLQELANMTLTPQRFDEMLNYLYPDPEDKKFDGDGNVKESKESKTRSKIRDRWEKLPSDLQFTDFGAFLAVAEYSDFEGRSVVRGSKEMDSDEKEERQREKRLDSSLFGTAQKEKQRAVKIVFNFDKIKAAGGITA